MVNCTLDVRFWSEGTFGRPVILAGCAVGSMCWRVQECVFQQIFEA